MAFYIIIDISVFLEGMLRTRASILNVLVTQTSDSNNSFSEWEQQFVFIMEPVLNPCSFRSHRLPTALFVAVQTMLDHPPLKSFVDCRMMPMLTNN